MASSQSTVAVNKLEELETLGANEYIIAAGPGGKQFYATSGGYSAVHLPVVMLTEVAAGAVKKIIWASFGSRDDSWFFAFETRNGDYGMRIGAATPSSLQQYIARMGMSKPLLDSLRVQLGDNDSFLAWSLSSWAASGIPQPLLGKLRSMSSVTRDYGGLSKGALKKGSWPLNNIQWSRIGSFYLQYNFQHSGNWKGKVINDAWDRLWQDGSTKDVGARIREELAYVFVDPHADDGDAFVFFKKQQFDEAARFIMGFSGGEAHSNLGLEREPQAPAASVQRVAKKPEEPTEFQWATCKKSGRPHRNESWELAVEKGEKVKVLRDMGRNWYVVEGKKNIKGWVHGTWVDFEDSKESPDSKSAYTQFHEDLKQLLVPGQLRSFPDMRVYIDTCTKADCRVLKEDGDKLGICVHDLEVLLHGSGQYSKEWLKDSRNLFHPDRFARFCHVEHAEALKAKAEQLFVLYGILMQRA